MRKQFNWLSLKHPRCLTIAVLKLNEKCVLIHEMIEVGYYVIVL